MKKQDVASELNGLTERVIGAAIEVHRQLGPGFQEATYHRALGVELRQQAIPFETEVPVTLSYKGETIGEGRIDLLVDGQLVVELKAADGPPERFRRQAVAYLKASSLPLGLIINFNADLLRRGILRVANTNSD